RLQLAQVHADTAVAVDVDHHLVRACELRADRGRQAEAHGAHAAGGQPQPRLAKIEVLRRPHLVLTDAGADDRPPARDRIELLDHRVRLLELAVAVVVSAVLLLNRGQIFSPDRHFLLYADGTADFYQLLESALRFAYMC